MSYRQKAFTGKHSFLKGNLHTHTNRSDGKGSPEEVVKQYQDLGYDFLAVTDHNKYNFSSFGNEKITILPGMEVDENLKTPYGHKYFHTVCLGPEKGNGYHQDEVFPGGGTFTRLEEYQKTLDQIHEKKNLTIYCHPQWSGTVARDFEDLKGNFAMEIFNTGCVLGTDCDENAAYWDELLLQGKKIFGVATDDGHLREENGLGWVVVQAENHVASILDALKEGAFYSSTGPEIYDFYIEDGKAVVKCSPCIMAGFVFGNVPNRLNHSKGDALLDEAVFSIPKQWAYVRAIVKDEKGRRAWSNPIFADEV